MHPLFVPHVVKSLPRVADLQASHVLQLLLLLLLLPTTLQQDFLPSNYNQQLGLLSRLQTRRTYST
jgi:hypothetical protein